MTRVLTFLLALLVTSVASADPANLTVKASEKSEGYFISSFSKGGSYSNWVDLTRAGHQCALKGRATGAATAKIITTSTDSGDYATLAGSPVVTLSSSGLTANQFVANRFLFIAWENTQNATDFIQLDCRMDDLPDREFNIARGVQGGQILVYKFGYNPDIANGSTEVIWSLGGNYSGFTDTAQTVQAFSYSTSDDITGTGARTVVIQGLDQDFNMASETVSLGQIQGTGPYAALEASNPTTTTWRRVFRAYVASTGSCSETAMLTDCDNVGEIRIANATNNVTFASIPAAQSQTLQATYTVPAGYTAYLKKITITVDTANKIAEIALFQITDADRVAAPFGAKRKVWSGIQAQGHIKQDFDYSVSFAEKTDLFLVAVGGQNNSSVFGDFTLVLVPNEDTL